MHRERTRRTFLAALGSSAISLSGCAALDLGGGERDWDIDPVEHEKLVGAHYYMWYWGNRGYGANRGRGWTDHSPYMPELGQYDSRDPDIVNQHIAWALEHGINWFIHTIGSPGNGLDHAIQNSYLEAELADQMTWNLLTGFDHGNYEKNDDGTVPLDVPHNREQMRQYFQYYDEHYFDTPGYLHIDGRPVLFDFSTPSLTGDIAGAFAEAKKAIDSDPYLVANPGPFWTPPTIPRPEIHAHREEMFDAYDAVQKYATIPPVDVDEAWRDDYVDHWKEKTEDWLFMSQYHDTGFIPTVMPGFNDTEIKWDGRTHHEVFDPSPEEFAELGEAALDYVDPDLDAVIITSWNEFPEGTPVEPTEEYGMDRLETVKQELGTRPADSVAAGDHPLIELSWDQTTHPNSSDTRELAFMLTRLDLGTGGDTLRSYDIGTMDEEPHLVTGTYGPAGTPPSTARWLGGPDAHTALYIHDDAADATTATLTGYPIEPSIAADIYRDGEHTDHVTFDDRGVRTYTISLRPDR